MSAFGGIVAVNRAVDADLAKEMAETFLECVIAPDFTPAALGLFAAKKGLRLLRGEFAAGDPAISRSARWPAASWSRPATPPPRAASQGRW